ncbi:Aurofusarin cluster transcription factor aurR2 [Colletotrichum siamense]|nr:Aurofusarin cluster transcription factor aurR2 [Colletotrichum siamense]
MAELKITRGHSCVPCQNRKIRCNGHTPCTYCIKTGKDCVKSARGSQSRPRPTSGGPSGSTGQVVANGDERRYVEDNKLWTSLGGELGPRSASSEDERSSARHSSPPQINLIFGHQQMQSPELLHPSPIQSFKLWQVFLSNVHPLTKIIHGPSMQEEVLRMLSNPTATDRSTEPLIFSIYLIAVVSLTDEECRNLLDEPREKHLARYRYATEVALSRVDFLRSTNLKVLQAFTIYLLALRYLCDNDILWLMTGLATRMGQRMGLHRETSLKGLSPFEAEMRRRVWWQIIILDGRAAQVTGASMNPSAYLLGDTNKPVNVNDGDLVPSMGLPPPPSPITTEMAFCSVRIEIGAWMIHQKTLPGFGTSSDGRAKFLKAVDDLENTIEHRYLRNIDKGIPLNQLALSMARSAICQLRISTCHPMRRQDKDTELSPDQIEMLLENSMEVIQYDIVAHTTPSLQHFLWHVSNFFPFETFVLLVGTLPSCANSQLAERAWNVINQVYEHHPSFISNRYEPLYRALGNLTCRSWKKAQANGQQRGFPPLAEPPFMSSLRRETSPFFSQKQNLACNSTTVSGDGGPHTPHSVLSNASFGGDNNAVMTDWQQLPQDINDGSFAMGREGMDMDWEFWQYLLVDKVPGGQEPSKANPLSFMAYDN